MEKILRLIICFTMIFSLFLTAGCQPSAKEKAQQQKVEQQKIEQQKQDEQKRLQAQKRKEMEQKKQAEAKENALDVARSFVKHIYNEEYEAMKDLVYCPYSDKSRIQTDVDAMELNSARVRGYMGHRAQRDGLQSYQASTRTTIQDISGNTAYFKVDYILNGNLIFTVEGMEMQRGQDGKWRVNTSSFNDKTWNKMDELDMLRNFE